MSIYIGNNKATLVRGKGASAQLFKGGTKIAGFSDKDFLITAAQGETEIDKTYAEPLCAEIYGESTAIGDTFPKNLQSAENPVITVLSKSVTIPYTLRSIGDFCDFITIKDGKVLLTQNIAAATETSQHLTYNGTQIFVPISPVQAKGINSKRVVYPEYALGSVLYEPTSAVTENLHWCGYYNRLKKMIHAILSVPKNCIMNNYFEEIGYNAPLIFQYVMETPTVTDITDTETGQSLLSLRTGFPKTKVSISCGKLKLTAKIAD